MSSASLWWELLLWLSGIFGFLAWSLRDPSGWWYLVTLGLFFVGAWRFTERSGYPTFGLLLAFCLGAIGWVFIYRVDPTYAHSQWRSLVLCSVVFLGAIRFDWTKITHKYLFGMMALLFLLFTGLFGQEVGGAKAWLQVGTLRFAPSEFARVFLLFFLSGFFHDYRHLLIGLSRWPLLRYWGPLFVLMGGVFLFLAVQRDLGPALLFYLVFLALSFTVAFSWQALAVYMGATISGAIIAWVKFPHFRNRIHGWLVPWDYAETLGYQILQGIFAVNAGGFWGTGVGAGIGYRVPAAHTDYLFVIIAEELGLLGATLVLLFYLLLVYWALGVAKSLSGRCRLLALGIVYLWSFQVFLVIGGILRIVPLTGMTLPFLSFGGSSLAASWWLVGILTSMGRRTP